MQVTSVHKRISPSPPRSYKKQFPEVFYKRGVLKSYVKVTGKQLFQSLFLHKVAGVRTAVLLKMIIWDRCFPVNFAKFLRTGLIAEHHWATASKLFVFGKRFFLNREVCREDNPPSLTNFPSYFLLLVKNIFRFENFFRYIIFFSESFLSSTTAQKVKFSMKDFFRKLNQIRSFLRIWSHLLEISLMENFIFCTVYIERIKLL